MRFHSSLVLGLISMLLGIGQATAVSANALVSADRDPAFNPVISQAEPQVDPLPDPLDDPFAEPPLARVDPDSPIRIDVVNGGELPIMFELTEPIVLQRELPPLGEISFGTTHTSYLPPPLSLLAYPLEDEIGINLYVVSAEDNVIEVVVSEQLSDIPGGRSMVITETGGIYLF